MNHTRYSSEVVMDISLTVTVSRLHAGKVRDYLNEVKFMGGDIEWIESSGWISRDFLIRGDVSTLRNIQSDIERWTEEVRR